MEIYPMKLDEDIYRCALQHVVEFGDTDIFPYPFELHFLRSCADSVCTELSTTDLNQYSPMSLIESLIPKTKFGFRLAHQPFPIDTIIFTALVLKIFDAVEAGRDGAENIRAFSYRKTPGLNPKLFAPDRTYRDWLVVLQGNAVFGDFTQTIRTDISDFYARIYRHRLENILASLSGEPQIVRKIERFIADWRSHQSFGLPVGSSAARLLAEAALNDTDMALIAEGFEHTRYVDDIVIFIRKDQDAYGALAFLAKHLSENEGLSLNNQKTKVFEWADFYHSVREAGGEDEASKTDSATEKLFWAAYGKEDLDQEALTALTMKDLRKELEELIEEEFWDMGKIRVVLHAMRLVKKAEVAQYIKSNLNNLVAFAKDICLLIEEFVKAGVPGFEGISGQITDLLLSPRMRPLDCSRAWFLELGVREIVTFDAAEIRRLDSLTGTLDIRQLHLIRWRANDQNYFRSRKSRVNEVQAWAQPSFIFGARCLPIDEYSHWIRGIKSRLQFPLGKQFADWCLASYSADPLK
jgi:hypothetical protein